MGPLARVAVRVAAMAPTTLGVSSGHTSGATCKDRVLVWKGVSSSQGSRFMRPCVLPFALACLRGGSALLRWSTLANGFNSAGVASGPDRGFSCAARTYARMRWAACSCAARVLVA